MPMNTIGYEELHRPCRLRTSLPALLAAALLLLLPSVPGFAGTVKPSGTKGYADCGNITAELARSGSVTLVPGKTYYLSSPIHAKSHQHIEAEGATIVAKQNLILNDPTKASYKALTDFSIHGGTWICEDKKNGYKGTSIKFAHASKLSFTNMVIRHTNYSGHALEFVACKDVTVDGCTISALGSPGANAEEMVQIDIATDSTAPFLKSLKLNNGACCRNVTVSDCTISGNRALVTGWAYTDKRYQNRYHTNIVIRDNRLTSRNREGLTLMNVKNAVVTGNTILSRYNKISDAKSSGVQCLLMGVIPNAALVFRDNTIKGGAYALKIGSGSTARYKSAEITGNRLYCRRGKNRALDCSSVRKLTKKKNRLYAWDGK